MVLGAGIPGNHRRRGAQMDPGRKFCGVGPGRRIAIGLVENNPDYGNFWHTGSAARSWVARQSPFETCLKTNALRRVTLPDAATDS